MPCPISFHCSKYFVPKTEAFRTLAFLGVRTVRGVQERGPATLAAELWCAEQGVDWIRTHDVRALSDALVTRAAIRGEA